MREGRLFGLLAVNSTNMKCGNAVDAQDGTEVLRPENAPIGIAVNLNNVATLDPA